MAVKAPKRQKRSLQVRKIPIVAAQQDESVNPSRFLGIKTNTGSNSASKYGHGAGESAANGPSGDNSVTDVSESLTVLRQSLCKRLPAFLGLGPEDWRNLPPLSTPSDPKEADCPESSRDPESAPPWSPLPVVCRTCARRTRCPGVSPEDATNSDHTAPLDLLTPTEPAPLALRDEDNLPGVSNENQRPTHSKPLFKKTESEGVKRRLSEREEKETRTLREETRTLSKETRTLNEQTRTLREETRTPREEMRTLNEKTRTLREETTTPREEMRTLNEKTRTLSEETRTLREETTTLSEEKVPAAAEDKQSASPPVDACPLCQFPFYADLSQVDRDGHIAACFAAADDDVTW